MMTITEKEKSQGLNELDLTKLAALMRKLDVIGARKSAIQLPEQKFREMFPTGYEECPVKTGKKSLRKKLEGGFYLGSDGQIHRNRPFWVWCYVEG